MFYPASAQSRGFNGSAPKCCIDGGRDFQPLDRTVSYIHILFHIDFAGRIKLKQLTVKEHDKHKVSIFTHTHIHTPFMKEWNMQAHRQAQSLKMKC
jgi:hypothetical protein